MSQYNIAVLVGSLRRDSFNAKLAKAIEKLAPAEFAFKHSQIGDLPLYNQDDDANQAEPVKRLKAEIKAAQGLLFVTPEYNRSVPGVLKNAIDNASRPYGQSAFAGKPVQVLSGFPSARSVRRWPNSIYATSWPILTSQRLANPKRSSRPKKACSMPTVGLALLAGSFSRIGWRDTLHS